MVLDYFFYYVSLLTMPLCNISCALTVA